MNNMEYTEKEKRAIEILANDNWEYLNYTDNEKEYNDLKKSIEIVVNLAKKQQKEIDRLEILKQGYVPIEKYNELLNSKVGVDLSYDNYIHKEAIVNVLNKYAHEPIEETIVINFYKELQELLGE